MEQTLKKLRSALNPIYGKGETEAIIRIIFHHLKGWNLTEMLIHQQDELSDFIKGQVDSILQRLLNHEPIQYITGEARFHGMEMKIHPGVLIPRPETEELVDLIIDHYQGKDDLDVLDLCTGSGCIAISLARNLPFSKVTAIDFSEEAIQTAKENSELLKTKIEIIKDDIFSWSPEKKFDIIVSNPPYVLDREALNMEKNVLNFEPHEALFVRDDKPLEFYDRIANIAKKSLKSQGMLYLEINPIESEALIALFKEKGFNNISLTKDSFGKNRFISASLKD